MRLSLSALAISGALAIAYALSPAIAQNESATRTDSTAKSEGSAKSDGVTNSDSVTTSDSAAKSESAAKDDGSTNGDGTPKGGGATMGSGTTKTGGGAVQERDVKTALSEMTSAWHDYVRCNRPRSCSVYFESYGVALTFNDGTITPFSHTQRLAASGHDCIVNARAALAHGDRGLAVQWVMASNLQDLLVRNWMAEHPDAVIAALNRCCY